MMCRAGGRRCAGSSTSRSTQAARQRLSRARRAVTTAHASGDPATLATAQARLAHLTTPSRDVTATHPEATRAALATVAPSAGPIGPVAVEREPRAPASAGKPRHTNTTGQSGDVTAPADTPPAAPAGPPIPPPANPPTATGSPEPEPEPHRQRASRTATAAALGDVTGASGYVGPVAGNGNTVIANDGVVRSVAGDGNTVIGGRHISDSGDVTAPTEPTASTPGPDSGNIHTVRSVSGSGNVVIGGQAVTGSRLGHQVQDTAAADATAARTAATAGAAGVKAATTAAATAARAAAGTAGPQGQNVIGTTGHVGSVTGAGNVVSGGDLHVGHGHATVQPGSSGTGPDARNSYGQGVYMYGNSTTIGNTIYRHPGRAVRFDNDQVIDAETGEPIEPTPM